MCTIQVLFFSWTIKKYQVWVHCSSETVVIKSSGLNAFSYFAIIPSDLDLLFAELFSDENGLHLRSERLKIGEEFKRAFNDEILMSVILD